MAPEEVFHRRNVLLAAQTSGSLPDDTYELDGRACDNFALGLVAYQFLTGHFPFPRLMALEEHHKHFLALDTLAQLQILAAAYHKWLVGSFCSSFWFIKFALLFKLAQFACQKGFARAIALTPQLETSLIHLRFHGHGQPVAPVDHADCMLSVVTNAGECLRLLSRCWIVVD